MSSASNKILEASLELVKVSRMMLGVSTDRYRGRLTG